MKRKIIKIDQEKCNGCGLCLPNCPEGAIQLIDGKARLVSDLLCDGLGACLGHCPEGAITVEEREAEPYDERKVMASMIPQGGNTIRAHLNHLKEHGEVEYYRQALQVLQEQGLLNQEEPLPPPSSACPGSRSMHLNRSPETQDLTGRRPSQLSHWPIQLHLISPTAAHFHGSDLLLAADCTAFSLGDFHKDYLSGKTLIIACPKLDEGQEVYLEKLTALIDRAQIHSLTVLIMQVPCCSGLLRLAQRAVEASARTLAIRVVVVGIKGEILREDWLSA